MWIIIAINSYCTKYAATEKVGNRVETILYIKMAKQKFAIFGLILFFLEIIQDIINSGIP